jgi:hypothetical protein
MIEIKKCIGCGGTFSISEFYLHRRGDKINPQSRCKTCFSKQGADYAKSHRKQNAERQRAWAYRTGRATPMRESKECSDWLGIHIAEKVLSRYFEDIKRMPPNNPGYDFECKRGYKIDVKSSCLHHQENKTPRWRFVLEENKIADQFFCIGFDNRDALNPCHLWLINGKDINEKQSISISDSPGSLQKWAKYEKPLDKVIECCNALKDK